MTHRFADFFPQFSERRLVFENSPEASKETPAPLPADALEGEVENALGQIDLPQIAEQARVSIIGRVHDKLKAARADASKDLSPKQKENLRKRLPAEKDAQDEAVDKALDRLDKILAPDTEPAPEKKPDQSSSVARPPAEVTQVSDIPEEKPAGEKTMMDQVKGFLKGGGMAMIGPFIKGFIALRRLLIGFSNDQDAAKKQLEGIEKLYGQFFGAAELQKFANEHLQKRKSSLKVIEGNFDGSAYGALKVPKFEEWITKQYPNATKEQKVQVRESDFDKFLTMEIDGYVKKCQENGSYPTDETGEKNAEYVTTLNGILAGEKPKQILLVQQEQPDASPKNVEWSDTITFAIFQSGVKVDNYTIQVLGLNLIEVNGKKWKIEGKEGDAKGATIEITNMAWDGNTLLTETKGTKPDPLFGFFPLTKSNQLERDKDAAKKLLNHLAKLNTAVPLYDKDNHYTGADLVYVENA